MTCVRGRDEGDFDVPITMAFQPIVDVSNAPVFTYEALVRRRDRRGGAAVMAQVSTGNRYGFDPLCRSTAIETAAGLDLSSNAASLSINFLPKAVYDPKACIRVVHGGSAFSQSSPDDDRAR